MLDQVTTHPYIHVLVGLPIVQSHWAGMLCMIPPRLLACVYSLPETRGVLSRGGAGWLAHWWGPSLL
jgi:hypothetical protein